MTLGIAVCLQDGALLMADGRLIKPFVPNTPPNDNVNKITRIGRTTAVISFGIDNATSFALYKIDHKEIDNSTSPPDIIHQIEYSTSIGWTNLIQNLGADVDIRSPFMRAGFLVGGYIQHYCAFRGRSRNNSEIVESNYQVGTRVRYAVLRRTYDYYEQWY